MFKTNKFKYFSLFAGLLILLATTSFLSCSQDQDQSSSSTSLYTDAEKAQIHSLAAKYGLTIKIDESETAVKYTLEQFDASFKDLSKTVSDTVSLASFTDATGKTVLKPTAQISNQRIKLRSTEFIDCSCSQDHSSDPYTFSCRVEFDGWTTSESFTVSSQEFMIFSEMYNRQSYNFNASSQTLDCTYSYQIELFIGGVIPFTGTITVHATPKGGTYSYKY
jgi:hypothetical protein